MQPPGRRHGTASISPLRGGGVAGTRATGGSPVRSGGGGRVRSGWGAGAGSRFGRFGLGFRLGLWRDLRRGVGPDLRAESDRFLTIAVLGLGR